MGLRGSCAGTPAWARPPRRRLRAQAGTPLPPGPEAATGRAEAEGAEVAGPGRRSRLRKEAWGPALSSPLLSSRRPHSASLHATRSHRSPLADTPQPTAQRAGSGEHQAVPQPAACCGAGTRPIRNQVRAEEGGAAPDGSLAPPTMSPPQRPRIAALVKGHAAILVKERFPFRFCPSFIPQILFEHLSGPWHRTGSSAALVCAFLRVLFIRFTVLGARTRKCHDVN